MSRDLTPREMYLIEQENIKKTGESLFYFMRNLTLHYNGESSPLHSEEEMSLREQYPALGKYYDKFHTLHRVLSKIEGGLDFLRQKDDELSDYIKTSSGDLDGYLIQWFEGKLDKNFYYSERNDTLFYEHMRDEALERSHGEHQLNTQIEYLYRDADNYKVWNECIINGILTAQQQALILRCLNEGEWFIPHLVGLPEKQFEEWDDQSDHPWFELGRDAFRITDREATVDITANELTEAFIRCEKNGWSEKISSLDSKIQDANSRTDTSPSITAMALEPEL